MVVHDHQECIVQHVTILQRLMDPTDQTVHGRDGRQVVRRPVTAAMTCPVAGVEMDEQEGGLLSFEVGHDRIGHRRVVGPVPFVDPQTVFDDADIHRVPIAEGSQHGFGHRFPHHPENGRIRAGGIIGHAGDDGVGKAVELRQNPMQHGTPVLCADGGKNRFPLVSDRALVEDSVEVGRGRFLEESAPSIDPEDDHMFVSTFGGRLRNYFLRLLQNVDFQALRTGVDVVHGLPAVLGRIGLHGKRKEVTHLPLCPGGDDPGVRPISRQRPVASRSDHRRPRLGPTIQYGVLFGELQFYLRTGAGCEQNEKESDA